jgi:sortase A
MEGENPMTRTKKGAFFMVAGILLMVSALSLFFYNQFDAWRAGKLAEAALAEVARVQTNEHPSIALPFPGGMPTIEMPSVTVDGHDYIGSLAVPILGLELPVLANWDFDQLRLAPSRYHGSIVTNDLVIAAHNYQSHFAGIEKLSAGDEVVFITMEGIAVHYSVSEVVILNPMETEEMIDADGWDLTLFTCTYSGEARVTVRCSRESRYEI